MPFLLAPLFASMLSLALVMIGCGPAVVNATRPSAGVVPPAAGERATIIVAQPNIRYPVVSILDGNGALIGQLSKRSHTVLQIAPGAFRLYVVPENIVASGDRIEGTVLAGKVYYGLIGFRWPGLNFTALTPRAGVDWRERTILLNNPRLELDSALAAKATAQLGDIPAMLRKIDAWVSALDAEQQAQRVIRPQDGL